MPLSSMASPSHTSPSWNQAVRITSSKFTRICGWINDARIGC